MLAHIKQKFIYNYGKKHFQWVLSISTFHIRLVLNSVYHHFTQRIHISDFTFFKLYCMRYSMIYFTYSRVHIVFLYSLQRLSPTETDRRIQSKLGDYSVIQRLIDNGALPHGSPLIGVNASTIPIPPIRPSPSQPYPQPNSSSSSSSSSTNRNSSHLYNQQQSQQHHTTQSNAFGKSTDNKTAYNGRYSSAHPPVKHDVSFSSILFIFTFHFYWNMDNNI